MSGVYILQRRGKIRRRGLGGGGVKILGEAEIGGLRTGRPTKILSKPEKKALDYFYSLNSEHIGHFKSLNVKIKDSHILDPYFSKIQNQVFACYMEVEHPLYKITIGTGVGTLSTCVPKEFKTE